MKLLVTNIQPFCLHDGPGVRTTVFLKGCNLHCPWCCNPENINHRIEYFYKESRCVASGGTCPYGECPFKARKCTSETLQRTGSEQESKCKCGAIGHYGNWYSIEDLYDDVIKDIDFWDNGGGVTFSGGEPLLQIEALEPLLKILKAKNINLCIETALFVSSDAIKVGLKYFNTWLVDVKLLDEARCRSVLGGELDAYWGNVDLLHRHNAQVCLRHPQIEGFTDDKETLESIKRMIGNYSAFQYEVIPEHTLGEPKYQTLGMSRV